MAEIGKAHVRIVPTFAGFTAALRVIAKHAAACADEIEAMEGDDNE